MDRSPNKSVCGMGLLIAGLLLMRTIGFASEAPLRLTIQAGGNAQPSQIQLGFDKPTGLQLFLEESGSLSEWSYFPKFWSGNGSSESLPLARESSSRFFRLSAFPSPADEWVTATANTNHAEYRLFYSNAIQRPVSYHVHLPAAYANEPQRRFPVIYWLHGAGAGISGVIPISQLYANAMNQGLMPPAILVFANGLPFGMWCDSKNGLTPMESIVMLDLIPHVDDNFRTIANRQGRIVEGFSMGGYGAGRLGLKFAGQFRGLSMMGAGALQLDFLNDPTALIPLEVRQEIFADVYGNDSVYFETQSPWRQAEQSAGSLPPGFTIRMVVGDADAMLTNNRALSAHLNSLNITHFFRELPGVGHDALQVLTGLGAANWLFYRNMFPASP